ncbi:MAG: hypothetical protein QOE57_2849 [Acidimicrobiaceae bacterium]|nr:hypothetical protein [Acidimicrobiaceae bacterium]
MTTLIKPLAAAGAGDATRISVAAFHSREIVTALRNGSGNLELITWHTPDNAMVTRGADSGTQAGAVDEVALTLLDRLAITAVRNGSGNLQLISWSVPEGLGSVTRRGSNGAGAASHIAVAFVGRTLITALRNGSGNLELISWAISGDGTFTRLADSGNQAGAVSVVSAASLGQDRDTVVTAVRTSSGSLKLIAWRISTDGRTITRLFDSADQAGAVGEIATILAHDDSELGGTFLLTAVTTGAGTLRLIEWGVDVAGIRRLGDSRDLAGAASHIAIAPAGPAATYLSSMRRGSGDLELIAFEIGRNAALTRTGDYGPNSGGGTNITETAITSLGDGRAVTAIRLRDFLNVTTWQVSRFMDAPVHRSTTPPVFDTTETAQV